MMIRWTSAAVAAAGCFMIASCGESSGSRASHEDLLRLRSAPRLDQQQLALTSLREEGASALGGYYKQELAQVVTAGITGTLAAVSAPISCTSGATTVIIEIQGVIRGAHDRPVPDGTVRSHTEVPSTMFPAFADVDAPDFRKVTLSVSTPVAVSAGDSYALVFHAEGECGMAQSAGGDLYGGGDASYKVETGGELFWAPLGSPHVDLPFQTWVLSPVRSPAQYCRAAVPAQFFNACAVCAARGAFEPGGDGPTCMRKSILAGALGTRRHASMGDCMQELEN